ncbi:MAG TPA: sulfur carrier protein ThiS [Bryobacteraceae bacterium]|nr:sulfur carrier protein ThiS [Bryobacteraceae bacterium]
MQATEFTEAGTIGIVVNGEAKTIPRGLHVGQLLEWLAIDKGRVAVELNRSIVRKQDWAATSVEEGARVEVVWFVGGG